MSSDLKPGDQVTIKATYIGKMHGELKFKTSIGTGICSKEDIASASATNGEATAWLVDTRLRVRPYVFFDRKEADHFCGGSIDPVTGQPLQPKPLYAAPPAKPVSVETIAREDRS